MRNFYRNLFLIAGLFLSLSGIVYPMASRPPAPVENSPETKPVKRVLTLEESYELALRRSETIASVREEIAKTKASWMKATGEAIGEGNFVITNSFQEQLKSNDGGGSSVGSTLNAGERRERKFTFSQPLFQGFRTLGALTGAGSLTKQRVKEYERSKEFLFLEVSEAFYGLLRQKKNVETSEGIHQLLDERVGELKQREKVGRSRLSEVSTAKSKIKILEAQLAEARGALAIAESLMEFYTGVPAEEAVYREDPLPNSKIEPTVDLEAIAKERADVEAARQAMKTARQAIIIAQSDLWPKITLDANRYEKREGFQSDIDWDMLFKINVPLYKGGETLGELKETYSEWKQAKLNYSLVKRQAELEIKESYQSWLAAKEQNKALKQAVKAAQENYRLQSEDYQKNLVNNLDVLTALEELFNASQNANRIYYQMKQTYWAYLTAVGDCCSFDSSTAKTAGAGERSL